MHGPPEVEYVASKDASGLQTTPVAITQESRLAEAIKLLGILDARGVLVKDGHHHRRVEIPSRRNDLPASAQEFYQRGYTEERRRQGAE